jgi:Fe-S-cluster containining protein
MHSSLLPISILPVKELLAIPAEAAGIHLEIVKLLDQLETADCTSCLEQEFKLRYFRVWELFEQYQNIVVKNSQYSVGCKRGCSNCCNHWVEDVNSFEAEIIVEYIRKYFPDRIDFIIDQCKEDVQLLNHIEELTLNKIDICDSEKTIDHIDLVLSVFYQMKKPCPLISDNGTCSVYTVRPLTCRIYMSFSDPVLCNPEYQDQDDIATYLLNLEENANAILDRLHFRYQRFAGESGLRSLLLKHLLEQ